MISSKITNEMLSLITEIEKNKFIASSIRAPVLLENKLRKNSMKRSSYASNKIEGNPLSLKQANEAIDKDEHHHFLKPEQEIRNYYLAIQFLEKQKQEHSPFSKDLILQVQKIIVKGEPKEKIGIRKAMPPGMLFAVYDSTQKAEYIPPEFSDIPPLLDELVDYVNTSDDHPLIIAAIVHYQLVTIHPFEDGNGRTARVLSNYIMDINGYGFNGLGSLEEYFAYNLNEYYSSLQMGLPSLYYLGRNNPPNSSIWLTYFLRMVLLYSSKVCEIQRNASIDAIKTSLSVLKDRDKSFLKHLLRKQTSDFYPIELANELNISNKTVINRMSILAKNGFVTPILIKERIRSYRVSSFTNDHKKEILKALK